MSTIVVDPCGSSPCKNDGECSRDGKGGFTCDCSSTGFNGPTCNIGNIHLYINIGFIEITLLLKICQQLL